MTTLIQKPILLPTSYLPPVSYFALLTCSTRLIIERHETYPRQTLRNRCCIMSANGPLRLSIPVTGNQGRQETGEKTISPHSNWQLHHWKSICSAYSKAPFFIYYRDMLEAIFQKPFSGLLIDWNAILCQEIASETGLDLQLEYTNQYHHDAAEVFDLRKHFKSDKTFSNKTDRTHLPPYYQVFEHKFGFVPDISIIDLLFNMGPDTISYLHHAATVSLHQLREG